MSFAAMAAWQAWLVIGLAVAAGVGLFLLKLRPPQIIVPSLTLWHRVLDEARERTLWERIRRAVSLAVVVLITLALALAILRPQANVNGTSVIGSSGNRGIGSSGSGQVAIVIDSSWSMLAETTSGHTRWDRAVARARALASGAGGENVVLSTTADGLVEGPTADVALIEAALDRIAPSGGEDAPWPTAQNSGATYFMTDGAVARSLPPGVIIESVFEPAANVAVTAFDVRPGASLELAGQAFLEVANYAAKSQDVRITMTRGSATVLDTHVELAAGAALQRMIPLDRGGDSRLRARVSARENALVVDDEAVAWIPGAHPIAVTVVSDDGSVLFNFLKRDPGVKATLVSPRAYKPAAAGSTTGDEDIVIFDRVVPAEPPTRPALFIAPPAATWLGTPGVVEHEPDWELGGGHPILQGLDVLTMALKAARPYAGAGLEPVAISAKKTPLILVADAPDRRLVVLTFSVSESKLTFAPGYPILMANIIEWLTQPAPPGTRRPGPIVFSGGIASIAGPDGQAVPVAKIEATSVATLTHVGFYEARAGGATSLIAVNAGGPQVSDLRTTRLPGTASNGTSSSASRGRPWWLIAVALGLVLIAAEWWTWQRRVTV
jgi:hypothetical protein